jgi:mannose-1-phosphate guanylyltransferase
MDLLLLSGGSGKRLWPLSNDSRSKQFLMYLDNNGIHESMIQRVWGQLEKLQLHKSTVIATSKLQVDMIHSQLGDYIPLIIEPERRDTFPAIALAATYLYSVKGTSVKEVVGVLAVDHYVDTSFFEKILDLGDLLTNSNADLALMGVRPTYPSEKYGYIIPSQNYENDYIQVSHFKEKPSEDEAKDLINNNALWNCGVFAFKLEYMIDLLQAKGLPIQYDEMLKEYHKLEKISFDYAVVEKAEKIVALQYSGGWKDLGTWNTLTEEMSTNQIGKGIISNDSTNTHLVNELDIPVTILGIKNAVVAASPDGILITDKAASPRIKEVLKGFEQRPMNEESRWYWYRILDHRKFDGGNEVLTKRMGIKAGHNLCYQKHYDSSKVWSIIKGEGELALNDEIRLVKLGDVIIIPVETKHSIWANTDLEFIEVRTGYQIIEDDIDRNFITWEEVNYPPSTLHV